MTRRFVCGISGLKCTIEAAIQANAHDYVACVPCARGFSERLRWEPLVHPKNDNVIILPDLEKPPSSLIVLVEKQSRDPQGRARRTKDFSMGLVLAVGPGNPMRKHALAVADGHATSRIFKGKNGIGFNDPMVAVVGDRVIVRHVYEAASTEWRGLLIVHDFDVLGAVEDEAAQ